MHSSQCLSSGHFQYSIAHVSWYHSITYQNQWDNAAMPNVYLVGQNVVADQLATVSTIGTSNWFSKNHAEFGPAITAVPCPDTWLRETGWTIISQSSWISGRGKVSLQLQFWVCASEINVYSANIFSNSTVGIYLCAYSEQSIRCYGRLQNLCSTVKQIMTQSFTSDSRLLQSEFTI